MRPSDNAISYLGKQELKKDTTNDGVNNPTFGNFGFADPAFQNEMLEEGWQPGWAWCAIFARVVFVNCFPEQAKILRSLFSPSAVQTFNNFKKAGYQVSMTPAVDSLVIWQTIKGGAAQATGHAGIVVSCSGAKDPAAFESVEGNTSTPGEREGYIVARHPHRVVADVKSGLKVLGFITITSKP